MAVASQLSHSSGGSKDGANNVKLALTELDRKVSHLYERWSIPIVPRDETVSVRHFETPTVGSAFLLGGRTECGGSLSS